MCDWSSDVCSSALRSHFERGYAAGISREPVEVAIADEFAGDDVTLAAAAMLFGEHRRLCNVADVDCRRADIECCARLAGGDIAQHAAVRRRLVILGAVGIGDAERDAGQAALAATLQEFCFGLVACEDVRRCALVPVELDLLGARAVRMDAQRAHRTDRKSTRRNPKP